jgi:hypothetical protein
MRVVILPAAESDLEDIWLTIAADDPLTATRIVVDGRRDLTKLF